jgi:hypothetical protein
LRLRNGVGEIRVKLGATDDGAIVLLMDSASNPTVRLASDSNRPTLRLGQPGSERVIAP